MDYHEQVPESPIHKGFGVLEYPSRDIEMNSMNPECSRSLEAVRTMEFLEKASNDLYQHLSFNSTRVGFSRTLSLKRKRLEVMN